MRTGPPVAGVRVAMHGPEAAAAFRDRVLDVWRTAFGPVADPQDWKQRFWEQHRSRADFRLVTAEAGEELLGFGWGYTGERGQWWADRVAAALGPDAEQWVGAHFEFVELAVRPARQGQGLGGQLHAALMNGLPHQRALLQTDADPLADGHRLYRARGWEVLGELPAGKVVMGKRLAA
ncbi:GNAT family N-acetyltransferase [Brachybacterium sp.]|uniref:GNAT family N-acetyltransferase n=1 Tax=Brachybacterium sp. TaxID=1891286 RepID=UPI002ED35F53